MDAPESNNATKGMNMGTGQNKKLKKRKRGTVIQFNALEVPASDEALN